MRRPSCACASAAALEVERACSRELKLQLCNAKEILRSTSSASLDEISDTKEELVRVKTQLAGATADSANAKKGLASANSQVRVGPRRLANLMLIQKNVTEVC